MSYRATRSDGAARIPSSAVRLAALVCASALLCGCGDSDELRPSAATLDLSAVTDGYGGLEIARLEADADAMEVAGQLFAAHCASCHGPDGRGSKGVTDLTQGRFNYGATEADIRSTIALGRKSEMPSMGRDLGEVELGQVVAYVRSFGSTEPLSDYEQRGQGLYEESCAACHGSRGEGTPELGASNLADSYWQHGGSMMNIRLAITAGAQSVCPGHERTLTPTEIELLTAYVLRIGANAAVAHDDAVSY